MRHKRHAPVVAPCVCILFLALVLGAVLAYARRYSKNAIARRAREAQLDAAQAVSRAARQRARHSLAVPEAEVTPVTVHFKGPALGNVVIKDADVFRRLKDELVEVDMKQMSMSGGFTPKSSLATPSTAAATSAPALRSANDMPDNAEDQERVAETAVDGTDALPTHAHGTLHDAHASGASDADGEPPSHGASLYDGGFVIVVCGGRVGDTSVEASRTALQRDVNVDDEAAAVEPTADGRPSSHAGGCGPTIQLYRHQPSRSMYGESRYVQQTTAEEVKS